MRIIKTPDRFVRRHFCSAISYLKVLDVVTLRARGDSDPRRQRRRSTGDAVDIEGRTVRLFTTDAEYMLSDDELRFEVLQSGGADRAAREMLLDQRDRLRLDRPPQIVAGIPIEQIGRDVLTTQNVTRIEERNLVGVLIHVAKEGEHERQALREPTEIVVADLLVDVSGQLFELFGDLLDQSIPHGALLFVLVVVLRHVVSALQRVYCELR